MVAGPLSGVEFQFFGTPVHHLRPAGPLPRITKGDLNFCKTKRPEQRDIGRTGGSRIQSYGDGRADAVGATEVLDLSKWKPLKAVRLDNRNGQLAPAV
jgi:hypothetical protein